MKQLWLTQDKSNNRPEPLPTPPKPRKLKPLPSGVYLIENQKLKKYYIGMSTDVHNRIRQHKSVLNKNKSRIADMQNDWNNHKDDFKFSIIQLADYKLIAQIERETIEQYVSEGKTMYNSVFVTKVQQSLIIEPRYEQCIKKVIEVLDKQLISSGDLIKQLELLF